HAFILDGPTIVARKETTARRDRRSAVNKGWRVGGMDQPTPGAFAYEQTDLSIMKHVRHQVAARAGHLVNDHHFRSPNPCGRTGEGITITGDVIKVAVKVTLQNVDDVIGG